jgi:hypothetical protein
MLAKHNIIYVGLPPRKISSLLRPVKHDLGLKTPWVYSIPCECVQGYIGQTLRSIETRIKELHRHIWLGHPDKSAVAEHRFIHNHLIKFRDIRIFSIVPGYMNRIIRKVVQLEHHPNSMKREDDLTERVTETSLPPP